MSRSTRSAKSAKENINNENEEVQEKVKPTRNTRRKPKPSEDDNSKPKEEEMGTDVKTNKKQGTKRRSPSADKTENKKSKDVNKEGTTSSDKAPAKKEETKKNDRPTRLRKTRKGSALSEDGNEEEERGEVESTDVKKSNKSKGKGTKTKPKKEPVVKDEQIDAEENVSTTSSTNSPHRNEHDYQSESLNANGKKPNFSILSWNVNGVKAWINKDGLKYINDEQPDIICLQETKHSEGVVPEKISELPNYKNYWCASETKGYAGVCLLSKIEPINLIYGIQDETHDVDGRCITAEYADFYVICVYVTNAGRNLVTLAKRLEWNKAFKTFVKDLDKKKPVIICGDMNVAHKEIDLKNPKSNIKNAGFTIEEREGMTDFLDQGFIDTYRKLYPDAKDVYTFWSYMKNARAKNIGWRLDYFLVSNRYIDNVCDNVIRDKIHGSDHCPIILFICKD